MPLQPLFLGSSMVNQAAGWDMGFHRHGAYEIAVVLSGRGIFQFEDSISNLEDGDVVLIQPDLLHRYTAVSPIRFGVFQIENMPQAQIELFGQLVTGPHPVIINLARLELEQFESLFKHWLRIASQPLKEAERYSQTWLDLFLYFLLQQQHHPAGQVLSVRASAEYIKENLDKELQIKELTRRTGLSESAFRNQFKEAYGLTPKQYQQQCRLIEARWLLRSSASSVGEIAQQLGFSSIHSFSAWFFLQ
jgi:AraC family transcriptional regulator